MRIAVPRRLTPEQLGRALLGIAGVLVVLAAWQVAAETGFIDAARTSMPTSVLPEIPGLLGSADFRSHLGDTLRAWGLAMAIMIVIAVPIGLAIGSLRSLRDPALGLVHVFRSIPSTSLIPVAILYFGLGLRMKVMLVAYAITWPLLLNAMYGAQSVDPDMRSVASSLRLRPWRVFANLTLPSAARYIGTGVRLAGGIGFVVVLGAELLGASRGLGFLIVRFQRNEMPELAFGSILITGSIGVLMFALLSAIERKLSPWAPEHRQDH